MKKRNREAQAAKELEQSKVDEANTSESTDSADDNHSDGSPIDAAADTDLPPTEPEAGISVDSTIDPPADGPTGDDLVDTTVDDTTQMDSVGAGEIDVAPKQDSVMKAVDEALEDDGLSIFNAYEKDMSPRAPQDDDSVYHSQRRLWTNLLVVLRSDTYHERMHKLLDRFHKHGCYKSPSLYRGLAPTVGPAPIPEYGIALLKAMETAADPLKRNEISKYINLERLYYEIPEWLSERLTTIFK